MLSQCGAYHKHSLIDMTNTEILHCTPVSSDCLDSMSCFFSLFLVKQYTVVVYHFQLPIIIISAAHFYL